MGVEGREKEVSSQEEGEEEREEEGKKRKEGRIEGTERGGGRESRERGSVTVYTSLPGQSRLLATANQQQHFPPLLRSQTTDCDKRNQMPFFLESLPPVCK